jgi:hypothetical protein
VPAGYYSIDVSLVEDSHQAFANTYGVRIIGGETTSYTETLSQYDLNVPGIVHYPIRVSANSRYIEDDHGRAVMLNGAAGWGLVVRLTREDIDAYLEDRRDKGFNAVMVRGIDHKFTDNPPLNAYGDHPFTDTLSSSSSADFTKPNEAYWEHVDYALQKAHDLNITVLLFPAYLGYRLGDEGWAEDIRDNGAENMRAYGEFLGERYGDQPNIIWMLGGDSRPGDLIDELDALAEGIKVHDQLHLFSAHSGRDRSAVDDYNRGWLDLNSTYADWTPTTAPIELRDAYQHTEVIPNFFIEGRYENESITPLGIRAQAYWSIVGGAFGQFFGNNPMWFFGTGWESELDSQGSVDMSYVGDLLRSRPFEKLLPDYDHVVMTGGYGDITNETYAGAAQANDGSFFVAYMPDQRTVTVDLSTMSGSSSNGWWYNPRNGTAVGLGTFPNNGPQDYTPPESGDWVLVIDDASLGYGPPGAN